MLFQGKEVLSLRYGENPHQTGKFYQSEGSSGGLAAANFITGTKEVSYNNLLDLDAALNLSHSLPGNFSACVIKHVAPCGAATAKDLVTALDLAWNGDPVSAFGSVIGSNKAITRHEAEFLITKPFIEAIVAPKFTEPAITVFRNRKGWGKTVRLVEAGPASDGQRITGVSGGFLVQSENENKNSGWNVVTEKSPLDLEIAALKLAWSCVDWTRSNGITLAQAGLHDTVSLVSVGGGQPSRVDAVKIAINKAVDSGKLDNKLSTVLASDAFFPFPDSIKLAKMAGIKAIIQPGGSKKDAAVIKEANEAHISMIFTGKRLFRH